MRYMGLGMVCGGATMITMALLRTPATIPGGVIGILIGVAVFLIAGRLDRS